MVQKIHGKEDHLKDTEKQLETVKRKFAHLGNDSSSEENEKEETEENDIVSDISNLTVSGNFIYLLK